MNSDEWRAAQVPTNLHATARGVARLYTALAARWQSSRNRALIDALYACL